MIASYSIPLYTIVNNNLNQYQTLFIMNFTLNFIKVITQIAVVATLTFITPAVLHTAIAFNLDCYFTDISSGDYQFGMGFATVIITIIYVVVYSMEMEERAERKRANLNQSLKF
jgi:uncharacterized membrane protein